MAIIPLIIQQIQPDYVMPTTWLVNSAVANGEDAINPLNIENGFTVGGTWFGMISGVLYLQHTRKTFNASGTMKNRVLRYLLGIAGLLILWAGLKIIFPSGENFLGYIFRYLRYFLTGYWVSAGAPFLFLKLNLVEAKE
jgi:hypothetical protein